MQFSKAVQKKALKLMDQKWGRGRIAQELGINPSQAEKLINSLKINRGEDLEVEHREVLNFTKPARSERPKTILVLPDAHVEPGVPNDRFTWLGRYIVEKQPDYVVCLGDFADMPSLSSYDRGKTQFEGRRYRKDVDAVIDAQEKLFAPISAQAYRPKFVMLDGNHEHRITRAVQEDSRLEGTIGLVDLGYEDFGWEVHPFLDVVTIQGFNFTHYFSNAMGKPISGMNPGKTMISKLHESIVTGHSHTLDLSSSTTASGRRIWGMVLGCYFEHPVTYVSRAVQNSWFRAATMLYEAQDGECAPSLISLSWLKSKFGSLR